MKRLVFALFFLSSSGIFAQEIVSTTIQQNPAALPDPCLNYPTPDTVQACERGRQNPRGPVPLGGVADTTTYTQTARPTNTMPIWQQALQPPVTTTTTSIQQTTTPTTVNNTPAWQQSLQAPAVSSTTTQIQTNAPNSNLPIWKQALQPPTTTTQETTTVIQK